MAKTIQAPVELAAQTIEVQEIRNRITETESKISALTTEHGKVLRGGYDIFQPGLPIDLVKKVSRDFPTPETQKQAAAFELEHIRPLRQQLTDLKAKLNAEELALGQLRVEFKSNNADQLLAQAIVRLDGATADLSAAKAHHANLEQRLTTARMIVLENERQQAAHDAVLAQALADGTEPPTKPEPQTVDSVTALQTALNLSKAKVTALNESWSAISRESNHLKGLISNRKVNDFMVELEVMAAAQGVDLKAVRDKLTDVVGPTLMHLMDGDELASLRHEVSTLRPENAKLKADVARLQDGILQASKKYA